MGARAGGSCLPPAAAHLPCGDVDQPLPLLLLLLPLLSPPLLLLPLVLVPLLLLPLVLVPLLLPPLVLLPLLLLPESSP